MHHTHFPMPSRRTIMSAGDHASRQSRGAAKKGGRIMTMAAKERSVSTPRLVKKDALHHKRQASESSLAKRWELSGESPSWRDSCQIAQGSGVKQTCDSTSSMPNPTSSSIEEVRANKEQTRNPSPPQLGHYQAEH